MEKLIFEIDVKGPALVQRIKNVLAKYKGICKWKIDLNSTYNLLTVEGICLNHVEIISILSLQGIEANRLYEE